MKRYFLAPILPIFLSSCSLFYGSTSSSVPIPNPTISAQNLVELSTGKHVYKINPANSTNSDGAFVTCVQECGLKKNSSLIATTRRLLVGLNSLEVIDQHETQLASNKVVASKVHAQLDEHPVILTSYSVTHRDCVTDIVGWMLPKSSQDDADAKLTALIEPVATQMASKINADSGN